MNHEELYRACIDKWGKGSQIEMCVEECAELIVSIKKLFRKKGNETLALQDAKFINFVSELADVAIMIEQMQIVFHCEERFEQAYKTKIDRLRKRIEKA